MWSNKKHTRQTKDLLNKILLTFSYKIMGFLNNKKYTSFGVWQWTQQNTAIQHSSKECSQTDVETHSDFQKNTELNTTQHTLSFIHTQPNR